MKSNWTRLRSGCGMNNKTSGPEDPMLTEDEREAQQRFQETLGRLVNTPHTPHKPSPEPNNRKAKPA
jgi:hypothetical protein